MGSKQNRRAKRGAARVAIEKAALAAEAGGDVSNPVSPSPLNSEQVEDSIISPGRLRRTSAWVGTWGWGPLMVAAVALQAEHEYAIALLLAVLAAASLAFAALHWRGVPESKKLTIAGRSVGIVLASALLVVSGLWIWGQKEKQPWSRIPRYFAYFFGEANLASTPKGESKPAPEPLTVSSYLGARDPYAEGSKFAGITWHRNEADVRVDIKTGAADIQNLDFTVQLDTEIMAMGQETTFPGCTMFAVSGNVAAMGYTVSDSVTGKPTAVPLNSNWLFAPIYRVQCLSVLAHTVISFSIASVAVDSPPEIGKDLMRPWQAPKILGVKGTYKTQEGAESTTHQIAYTTDFKPLA